MTVDAQRRIFKQTRCHSIGWELHERDQERVTGSRLPELTLERLPKMLFVQVDGAEMKQHHNLEPQVFAVAPRRVSWALDKEKTMWVTRTGFHLVPDFASKVHGVTGRNLSAAVADVNPFYKKPNQKDALMGYISISWVEMADNFMLAQAFPPMLFRQGPQPGPRLLMEFLRGNVPQADLPQRWTDIEHAKKEAKVELKDLTWKCCTCETNKRSKEYTAGDERHWLQN